MDNAASAALEQLAKDVGFDGALEAQVRVTLQKDGLIWWVEVPLGAPPEAMRYEMETAMRRVKKEVEARRDPTTRKPALGEYVLVEGKRVRVVGRDVFRRTARVVPVSEEETEVPFDKLDYIT